jgi:sulfur relay (sulfurtransferase) DsrF/TusC family protein
MAPYGTVYALESLEVVLIAAAFDQDVSLSFIDDGVYQLVEGQNSANMFMWAMKMFFMKHTSYSFNIISKNTTFIPT